MTDQNENPEIPESLIIIRFAAPGAVLMEAQWRNVYPGQLILAAEYLLQKGREFAERAEQQKRMEEEASKISTPIQKLIIPKGVMSQ